MNQEMSEEKRVEVSCPPASEQPVRVEADGRQRLEEMARQLREVRERGKLLEYLRLRRKV